MTRRRRAPSSARGRAISRVANVTLSQGKYLGGGDDAAQRVIAAVAAKSPTAPASWCRSTDSCSASAKWRAQRPVRPRRQGERMSAHKDVFHFSGQLISRLETYHIWVP